MRTLTGLFLLFFVVSCQPRNNTSSQNSKVDSLQDSSKNIAVVKEDVDKYFITNDAVGYFKIGESWQHIAEEKYSYVFSQGYGICVDACCDGGYVLGLKMDKDGVFIEDGLLTIGCARFDDDESEAKHKSNNSVFYISSDNCKAWYWKDKISYIFLYSDLFKTKDGIGVGTTLEDLHQKFGNIQFDIGWIEEDPNAFQIKLADYPNIQFILDVEDYKGDLDMISLTGLENKLKLSDFKPKTKIARILVQNTIQEEE